MICSEENINELISTQKELNETLIEKIKTTIDKINRINEMEHSTIKEKLMNEVSVDYKRLLNDIDYFKENIRYIQDCEVKYDGLTNYGEIKDSQIKKYINFQEHCSEKGGGCQTDFCKIYRKSSCPLNISYYIISFGIGLSVLIFMFILYKRIKRKM